MWLRLGPDRDRFISVLSDNATIIQASRLQHSSIVFSFALCLVALVHVEFELYAHQRMLQFLSHQREGNIYPLGKQTDCFRAELWEFRKLNDLWVLVFEWRPFIKESNILTKCTVESITGRFFIWFRVENSNVNCFIKERLSWISVSLKDRCGVVFKSLPFRSHTYT